MTAEQKLSDAEVAGRVDRVLLRMLLTPPDPHNVRTKKEVRGRKLAPQMIEVITQRCATMPREIKDDALQHAFLLFRSGDYKKSDLDRLLRAAMNLALRDQRGGHRNDRTHSLDLIRTEDGESLYNLLPANEPPIKDILDGEAEES